MKREDALIHAETGSGKTAIAAGPHAREKMKGKVIFMISPLIALQDEQVNVTTSTNVHMALSLTNFRSRFREEFKLEAVAVNSAQEGCTKEIMAVSFKFQFHDKGLTSAKDTTT